MSYRHRSKLLPRGALVEFVQVGSYVKVMAVDPVSFEEVAIVGDPKTSRDMLVHQAVKKLEFVLARRDSPEPGRRDTAAEAAVPRARRPDTPSGWEM